MIRYSLKCENGHSFDSWFQSASAFDSLRRAGHAACPECGSTSVEKSVMAPRVTTARSKVAPPQRPTGTEPPAAAPPSTTESGESGPLIAAQSEKEAAIRRLKAEVEAKSEYVGKGFAHEARAMHDGESDARAIWGEANIEEARSLIEDGVPVMPLPFTPSRKTN